jgi:hypothetical protein
LRDCESSNVANSIGRASFAREGFNTMRRAILVLASAILAGCSGGPASPSPTVEHSPAATPAVTEAPTPTPASTVAPEPTAEPERTFGPCPTTTVISVKAFVLGDPACFTTGDIEIRGWLDYPSPLGFEGPVVEPRWLWYPTDEGAALWFDVPQGDFVCNEDHDAWCYSFFPHRAPDSDLALVPLKRWVILTGHTHDPAAETCRYEDEPQPNPELVAGCRTRFVVTAIRDAP